MARWIKAAVLAVSVAAAAAGCGGGSSPSSSSPTSASPTATAASGGSLTAQQARTLAAAAVLRGNDLPGYSSAPVRHTAADAKAEAEEARCLGVPSPHYLARNFGTAFSKDNGELDSSADVAPSSADARRELAAITGSKARHCLEQALTQAIAASGGSVQSLSARLVPAKIAGADASFVYALSMRATFNGHAQDLAGYEVGTLVGLVEVDIQETGLKPLPVTLQQAEKLAETATARERMAQQALG